MIAFQKFKVADHLLEIGMEEDSFIWGKMIDSYGPFKSDSLSSRSDKVNGRLSISFDFKSAFLQLDETESTLLKRLISDLNDRTIIVTHRDITASLCDSIVKITS